MSGIVFKTAGSQTLSAADTLTPSMIGTQSGIQVSAAPASTLTVTGLSTPRTAGAAGSVTVTALDMYGNVASSYVGSVALSSSDGQAVLPPATAFTSADAGTRPFAVTLNTVGMQSITATDTLTATITRESASELELKVGDRAQAFIKASHVILAVE